MGKDLNGKELGRGITQRKDGRYMGRIHIRGSKKEVTLYDRNLKMLKNKVNTYRALAGTSQWDISMTVTEWFEQWMEIYNVPVLKAKARNIRAVLLTALYNSVNTINSYYGNRYHFHLAEETRREMEETD